MALFYSAVGATFLQGLETVPLRGSDVKLLDTTCLTMWRGIVPAGRRQHEVRPGCWLVSLGSGADRGLNGQARDVPAHAPGVAKRATSGTYCDTPLVGCGRTCGKDHSKLASTGSSALGARV